VNKLVVISHSSKIRTITTKVHHRFDTDQVDQEHVFGADNTLSGFEVSLIEPYGAFRTCLGTCRCNPQVFNLRFYQSGLVMGQITTATC
jgi:hypothetical protein